MTTAVLRADAPSTNADAENTHASRTTTGSVVYAVLFIVLVVLLSAWAVLDHFFVNLLPMGVLFPPLWVSLTAQGVTVTPGTMLFDNWGRATGRLFLVLLATLLFTECRMVEKGLSRLFGAPLRGVNASIHTVLGVVFTISLMMHVFFLFLCPHTVVMDLLPMTRVTPFVFENNGVADCCVRSSLVAEAAVAIVGALLTTILIVRSLAQRLLLLLLHVAGALMVLVPLYLGHSPHWVAFGSPVLGLYVVDRIVCVVVERRSGGSGAVPTETTPLK